MDKIFHSPFTLFMVLLPFKVRKLPLGCTLALFMVTKARSPLIMGLKILERPTYVGRLSIWKSTWARGKNAQ